MSQFHQFDAELNLMRRLQQHGVWIDEGVTDAAQRRENARDAITKRGLESVICGRGKDGKPVDYEAAFKLVYGEPL